MKLDWIVLSLVVVLSLDCYSQHEKVDSLFMAFKEDIEIEQKYHKGKIVWDDETRETYDCLLNICPINKLIEYTDDPNAFVRSQMFSGLAQKKTEEKILKEILNRHLTDSAQFTFGAMDWTVIEHMQWILDLETLPNIRECVNSDNQSRDFEIIFDGVSHNVLSKEALLEIDNLILPSNEFVIVSFEMNTVKSSLKSSSDKVTRRMKRIFKKLNSGDMVFFEQIKVNGPNGTSRELGSRSLMLE